MQTTRVYSQLVTAFNTGVRRIVNKGGTWSGKTIAHLQLLYIIAKDRAKEGVNITIVSESMPHLKQGAIKDFEAILKKENDYDDLFINHTDKIYSFGKSEIQFTPADITRATGPRRDIVYFNECNNIPYSIVSEYEQRTKESIFYDFNPVRMFWMEDKVISLPSEEYTLIISNYLDNQFCPSAIKREIERKAAKDPNFKRIHVDVEYGSYEGLIFPTFTLVDTMPETHQQRWGMDFGYSNDPTTLIDLRKQGGELWIDQLIYQTGMVNAEIIQRLKQLGCNSKIIADSAEPKSIEEIRRAGFNIHASVKGADSIRRGIDLLKSYPINITKRSVDLIREFRNYSWDTNRGGELTSKPNDSYNHCIDATRYAGGDLLSNTSVFAPALRSRTEIRRG